MILLQQLPALIGVLIGALASFLVTRTNDQTRWRRRHAARWDQRRLEAYVDYGRAVKPMIHVASAVAGHRGFYPTMPPMSLEEARDRFVLANEARAEKWEMVLLLGDPATIAAARAWHKAVWRMWHVAGRDTTTQEDWDEVFLNSGRARHEFYEEARRDLGVGGAPPFDTYRRGDWEPDHVEVAADRQPIADAAEP